MRFKRLYFLAYSILASFLISAQGRLPSAVTGNWMKTDGSNTLVIGLYNNNVCFKNRNWDIIDIDSVNDMLQLKLAGRDYNETIDILVKDSNTILLASNGQQQELKNIRSYRNKYRVEKTPSIPVVFEKGMAFVTGYIQVPPVKVSERMYVEVSYKNDFIGENEYFLTDIDKKGRFAISFPVFKPQVCTLNVGSRQVGIFYIRQGDSILVSARPELQINEKNPDYSQVMQRFALMGDNEKFNNDYQHFLWYRKSFDYPDFKFPTETIKGKSIPEKKHAQLHYYSELHDKIQTVMGRAYPVGKSETRFIDFIRQEIQYTVAHAALNNLKDHHSEKTYYQYKVDSADLQVIFSRFLADVQATALVHDVFYKLAAYYGSMFNRVHTEGRAYGFSVFKMDDRIKNDYGPLLGGNFEALYKKINKERHILGKMSNEEIIEKYFNGSREEAAAFKYIQGRIIDELNKEALDSLAYELNKSLYRNQTLKFAANLSQLLNGSWSDQDIKTPSIYRLNLFRDFSANGTPVYRLVDSLNRKRTLELAMMGLTMKIDSSLVVQVNNEADWQLTLKKFRGKVVVVWAFPHYFDRQRTMHSLYEMKKLETKYAGQNVVFIKLIQQRERSDRIKHLMEYLQLMRSKQMLGNVFYIGGMTSVGFVLSESKNGISAIFNDSGHAHQPVFYAGSTLSQLDKRPELSDDLDSVLAGRGRFYERFADYYFSQKYVEKDDYFNRHGRTWTRRHGSGNYSIFTLEEPEKPDYQTGDSVFHQMIFHGDSIYWEQRIVLYRIMNKKQNELLWSTNNYRREIQKNPGSYTYRFDKNNSIISVFDRHRNLYKKLKVIMMHPKAMVVESQQ